MLQAEALDEPKVRGFDLSPNSIGENLATRAFDLLARFENLELRMGCAIAQRPVQT